MGRIRAADVVGRSLGTAASEAPTYLRTLAIPVLAVAAVTVVQAYAMGPSVAGLGEASDPDPDAVAGAVGLVVAIFVLSMVALFFGVAATWDLLEGRRTGLRAVWRRHGDRLPAYLGVSLVEFLAAAGAMVLGAVLFFLVVPPLVGLAVAVYLFVRWYVAPVAVLVEEAGIRTALRRSGELTGGAKASVLGILAFVAVFGVVVSLPVSYLAPPVGFGPLSEAAAAAGQAPSLSAVAASAAADYVATLVTLPVASAALVHAYRDLLESELRAERDGSRSGREEPVREVAWEEET